MSATLSLTAEARTVVDVLETEAVEYEEGSIGWVSIWPFEDRDPTIVSDASVYRGQTGIGLFLAAHGHVTSDDRSKRMAHRVFRPWLETPHEQIGLPQSGGLTGIGSLIYSLRECSVLLDDSDYMRKAATIAASIDVEQIQESQQKDIIKGKAGLLLVLTELLSAGTDQEEMVRRRAAVLADALVEEAEPTDPGVGWSTQQDHPSIGLAHGAAGIGYALFKAAKELSEPHYRTIALKAFEFEDHHYSSARKNWPNGPDREKYQRTWCWGSEGILLSRYAIEAFSEAYDFPENSRLILEELITGTPPKQSLCHGGAGRAMALRDLSAQTSCDLALGDAATSLLEDVVNYRVENGYYAIPGLENAPASRLSLFRGIAGIGYACLYNDHPDRLPNPLLLESAVASR